MIFFFPTTDSNMKQKNKTKKNKITWVLYAHVGGTHLCYLRVLTRFPVAEETVFKFLRTKRKKKEKKLFIVKNKTQFYNGFIKLKTV